MSNPEASGRIALWVIELSEFDIQYRPRTAITGQVIADFIVEFTLMEDQGAEKSPKWSVHMDESFNREVDGAGVVLYSSEGDRVECMIHLDFPTTNNEAEYETLIAGLDLTKVTRAERMVLYCDSQVVISQVNDNYECKNERMKKYFGQVKDRVNNIQVKFVQVPREENEHANYLAKAASAEHMLIPSQVLSFVQISPVIDGINVLEIGPKSY